jgi:DNA adenine methylase
MILKRLGNKSRIAKDILQYFPQHNTYIELFFGAGGMFFNKTPVKYNFLNDLDSNVINLFEVLMNHKKELQEYLEFAPYHEEFFKKCKTDTPKNNIEKAVYFVVLSNSGYLGKPDTLKFGQGNQKFITIQNIEKTYLFLASCNNQFLNKDFKKVIKAINFKDKLDKKASFIYADPPYLDTDDNYSNSFTEQDSQDLFELLVNSGIKFAMSEFEHPFVLEQAKKHNLNIITIGERQSLKKRSTEILITNYKIIQQQLF